MPYCPKCHKKMEMGIGMVKATIGDAALEVMAPIYSCLQCDQSTTKIEVNIRPILKPEDEKTEPDPNNLRVIK